MPNFDTHAGLALLSHPEFGIEYAAGEVYDDAVRMAGGFPDVDSSDSLFYQGRLSNNSITDPAFDDQPALKAAVAAMRLDIAESGLEPRFSRLAGPATDILFSGVSLQRADAATAFLDACSFLLSPEGEALIKKHTRPSKLSGLTQEEVCKNVGLIAERGLNSDYSDAEKVVQMLKRRVAKRGSLGLAKNSADDHIVTKVFANQQVRLANAADDIYAGTVATITGEPTSQVKLRTDAPLLPIVAHVSSIVEKASHLATTDKIQGWEDILALEWAKRQRGHAQYERLFTASRAAAHFLLQRIAKYRGDVTITGEPETAPAFPQPWVGSLSHSINWAAAAITNQGNYQGLGINLECRSNDRLSRERAITPHEHTLAAVANLKTQTIYTIKEAVFKAVHPLVRSAHPNKFWYQDAEIIELDAATGKASIRLAPTDRGRRVGAILGDAAIDCYYLEKDDYSSSVCVIA